VTVQNAFVKAILLYNLYSFTSKQRTNCPKVLHFEQKRLMTVKSVMHPPFVKVQVGVEGISVMYTRLRKG